MFQISKSAFLALSGASLGMKFLHKNEKVHFFKEEVHFEVIEDERKTTALDHSSHLTHQLVYAKLLIFRVVFLLIDIQVNSLAGILAFTFFAEWPCELLGGELH